MRGAVRYSRLLSTMRKHDLSRRAPATGSRQAGHVSNASQKGTLRALLLDKASGVATELQRLREQLDYHATDDAAARRRRWRLGTVVSV